MGVTSVLLAKSAVLPGSAGAGQETLRGPHAAHGRNTIRRRRRKARKLKPARTQSLPHNFPRGQVANDSPTSAGEYRIADGAYWGTDTLIS
jgi:hypothetical protein